jgi:CRP-like cAMP-binding protein
LSSPAELDPREYVKTLEHLKKVDFLASVPDDDLRGVLLSLQKQTYGPNKTILFQGEIASRLFVLVRGSVSISAKSRGQTLALAELTPPAYFGEISLLRPMSATATATAGDEGAELIIFNHDALSELSRRIPDIQNRIQSVIDARLASKKKAAESDDEV